jgi:hypothetical protein
MSTAHAIGAVTKVLVNIVDEGLKAANLSGIVGSDVTVSALSPQRIDLTGASDPNQLNIFFYLALPNSGGSGFDLPTRDSAGVRVKNTPLALDLCYLATAYGSGDYFAEIILGHAMQVLHENPILARDAIREKLKPSAIPTNVELALADAGLADQAEQVKVSPEKLSTEEISRLWSAFGAEYRPTAAYRVSVVLIEARTSTKTALPVLERGVYVRQLRSPLIERLTAKSAIDQPSLENQPILPGYILVLAGQRLRGEITRIVLDGEKIDPPGASIHDDHIEFPLPATLRAGPHGVQIAHDIAMGSPLAAHTGTESNVLAFLLRPVIAVPVTATATQITVKLNPLVTATQKLRILLNELAPPADRAALGFTFSAPVHNGINVDSGNITETDTVLFDYNGVPSGDFLVRVQVDGAESVLETDPVTGAFSGPKVAIP